MSLAHFERNTRMVKLGRRWYTVGPVSVLRCFQLMEALGEYASILPVGDDAKLMHLISVFGLDALTPLVPTLVARPDVMPRKWYWFSRIDMDEWRRQLARDTKRIKPAQIEALVEALQQCNDVEYIWKAMQPSTSGSGKLTMSDCVEQIAQRYGRFPNEVLSLPMAEFLEIWDSIDRTNRVVHGDTPTKNNTPDKPLRPPDARDLTAKERANLTRTFKRFGVN